jgi:hypothetical protein
MVGSLFFLENTSSSVQQRWDVERVDAQRVGERCNDAKKCSLSNKGSLLHTTLELCDSVIDRLCRTSFCGEAPFSASAFAHFAAQCSALTDQVDARAIAPHASHAANDRLTFVIPQARSESSGDFCHCVAVASAFSEERVVEGAR